MISVDRSYITNLLARLVRTNSINPAFSSDTTDERAIAAVTEDEMQRLGLATRRFEGEPRRVSVTGTLAGRGGGRSLMLYAHYDTVGVEGMADPFSGTVHDGRLYGRGAYDMKCGLAACLGAVEALRRGGIVLAGDIVVAAVADEEVASVGIQDILREVRTDAAIVTEPTELKLCLAHKGFVWIEVVVEGRAAHGSRFQDGIDANMRMGRFLHRLDRLEQELRARPPHPLVGPPSLHAAVLQGGTGTSTYAARSRLEIERRTIPGESPDDVVAEIQAIADDLTREDPTFRATVRPFLARASHEVSPDATITSLVDRHATAVLGHAPERIGVAYWMDAAFIGAAGIETVTIGPTGAGAHAAEEWVELESVAALAQILANAAAEYGA